MLLAVRRAAAGGRARWPGASCRSAMCRRRQVARFIEEREPSLDDRLVSAVDVAGGEAIAAARLAEPMLADAARRRRTSTSTRSCRRESLRRAGFQAAAALLVLGVAAVPRPRAGAAGRRCRVADAVSLARRARGHARQRQPQGGHAAHDPGAAGRQPRAGRSRRCRSPTAIAGAHAEMAERQGRVVPAGAASVTASFKYRVVAGAVTSPTYDVRRASAARRRASTSNTRYPAGARLEPRTEADGGDIYAPAGTDVRVHVLHRSAGGDRADGARRRRSRSRSTAATPNEFTATLQVDRRQLVPRRAGRPRRLDQSRRHRVLHPHARGSAAGRAHRSSRPPIGR